LTRNSRNHILLNKYITAATCTVNQKTMAPGLHYNFSNSCQISIIFGQYDISKIFTSAIHYIDFHTAMQQCKSDCIRYCQSYLISHHRVQVQNLFKIPYILYTKFIPFTCLHKTSFSKVKIAQFLLDMITHSHGSASVIRMTTKTYVKKQNLTRATLQPIDTSLHRCLQRRIRYTPYKIPYRSDKGFRHT